MSGDPLPIGVTLGSVGVSASWFVESARRLDAAGYRAIWTWDHFMAKGSDPAKPVLEAWTALTAAAAVTEQAGIGSFVLNVMNRPPAVLARMATSLQELSDGRLRLGIGIGGHEREHQAYGIDFPAPRERADRLEEAIAVLRALWSGGPVDFEGRFFRLRAASARPVVTPPPILVGAHSARGVRIAARLADGWAAEANDFETLMPRYLEALDAAGRRREEQLVVLGIGWGRSGQDALAGSPFVERPREAVEEWLDRGVDEITVTARTARDVDALVAAAERW